MITLILPVIRNRFCKLLNKTSGKKMRKRYYDLNLKQVSQKPQDIYEAFHSQLQSP